MEEMPKEQSGAEKSETLDAGQEKIKELTETVDFWIRYAQGQLEYFDTILSENRDETTEHGRWVSKSLKMYSAMVPRFEEMKKYLEEGKLEFPWGGDIETELKDWENRRDSR